MIKVLYVVLLLVGIGVMVVMLWHLGAILYSFYSDYFINKQFCFWATYLTLSAVWGLSVYMAFLKSDDDSKQIEDFLK